MLLAENYSDRTEKRESVSGVLLPVSRRACTFRCPCGEINTMLQALRSLHAVAAHQSFARIIDLQEDGSDKATGSLGPFPFLSRSAREICAKPMRTSIRNWSLCPCLGSANRWRVEYRCG